MNELVKVKKIPNNTHLLKTANEMVSYISNLLATHFKKEEDFLFPKVREVLSNSIDNVPSSNIRLDLLEQIDILLYEHKLIEDKLNKIEEAISNIDVNNLENLDLKNSLLFPLYNLIATINHHADREDRQLFSKLSLIAN